MASLPARALTKKVKLVYRLLFSLKCKFFGKFFIFKLANCNGDFGPIRVKSVQYFDAIQKCYSLETPFAGKIRSNFFKSPQIFGQFFY